MSDVPFVVFTVGDVYHHEKTPWLWTHPAWQILNAGLANRAIGAGSSMVERWGDGFVVFHCRNHVLVTDKRCFGSAKMSRCHLF